MDGSLYRYRRSFLASLHRLPGRARPAAKLRLRLVLGRRRQEAAHDLGTYPAIVLRHLMQCFGIKRHAPSRNAHQPTHEHGQLAPLGLGHTRSGGRRYAKSTTFQQFIEAMPAGLPLSAKVYEVVLHHTHEILRKTVSWQIGGDVEGAAVSAAAVSGQAAERQIENEGGWLY